MLDPFVLPQEKDDFAVPGALPDACSEAIFVLFASSTIIANGLPLPRGGHTPALDAELPEEGAGIAGIAGITGMTEVVEVTTTSEVGLPIGEARKRKTQ